MAESLIRCALKFELHHVDVLLGLKDKVNAALGGMVLHLRIEAHQLEHNEQHVLIMKLQLAGKFVRRISEEALKTLHETVYIAASDILHKVHHFEG